MKHVTLVVYSYITYTHLFVNIIPNELEDTTFCNPLFQSNAVKFTYIFHQAQGCRVTNAGIDVIQL